MYNLTFKEAIDILIDGGAVKGEKFRNGIFLRLNSRGQLATFDAENFYREDTFVSIKSLNNQMFRELSVMTIKELSK